MDALDTFQIYFNSASFRIKITFYEVMTIFMDVPLKAVSGSKQKVAKTTGKLLKGVPRFIIWRAF